MPADAVLTASVDWDKTSQLSYAAADDTEKKRKVARVDHRSEDLILDRGKRDKVQASARDIARNFAIACWMIRRHMDYTCSFDFHSRTGNDQFDLKLELLMRLYQRRQNCDAAGRHRFAKMIRLAEARRVIDGDVGWLKLRNGTLQGIESDLIKNPTGQTFSIEDLADWTQGVETNAAGRALQYSLWRRTKTGLRFDRIVPARNLLLHGFFDRYDQTRGISPLVTALNPLRDVYENFDLALAKAKVTQLFALAIYRDATDGVGETTYTGDDEDQVRKDKYTVDFGRGPIKFEFDPGEKAEFLESKHPSSEFQNFTELVLAVALKSLDIPYSFYDEAHTNFFGSRAAWLHYERSCDDKRGDIHELLDQVTRWRMALWILDGELILPRGWTLEDAQYEWVPKGMPWWDPAKEVRGDLMAVGAGLDNPQRIVKERGRGDFYDNIDQIAEAQEYARSKGVKLSFDAGPEPMPEPNDEKDQ